MHNQPQDVFAPCALRSLTGHSVLVSQPGPMPLSSRDSGRARPTFNKLDELRRNISKARQCQRSLAEHLERLRKTVEIEVESAQRSFDKLCGTLQHIEQLTRELSTPEAQANPPHGRKRGETCLPNTVCTILRKLRMETACNSVGTCPLLYKYTCA